MQERRKCRAHWGCSALHSFLIKPPAKASSLLPSKAHDMCLTKAYLLACLATLALLHARKVASWTCICAQGPALCSYWICMERLHVLLHDCTA